MTLSDFAMSVSWPYGLLLDEAQIQAQAVNAARHYVGWGHIRSIGAPLDANGAAQAVGNTSSEEIDAGVELSDGEWAVIKPLLMLYVERENARALEASRFLGVDVYGRSVDTIEADITRYETTDLPRASFFQPIETI